jgi:hypothetical protein
VNSASCSNSPANRGCWEIGDSLSIESDFDAVTPPQGQEVHYNLEITDTTALAPDGTPRRMFVVNGQFRKFT